MANHGLSTAGVSLGRNTVRYAMPGAADETKQIWDLTLES